MGVEHYVVDVGNLRSFTLGRSLDLSPLQGSLPASPGRIYDALMDRWSKAHRVEMKPDEEQDWIAGIAAKLWAFCESAGWRVEFRSDCHFYDDESTDSGHDRPAYSEVYSRYDGERKPDPMSERVSALAAEAADVISVHRVLCS